MEYINDCHEKSDYDNSFDNWGCILTTISQVYKSNSEGSKRR